MLIGPYIIKETLFHVVNTPMIITGFCAKTKKENGEKVFINVCQADNVSEFNILYSIKYWYSYKYLGLFLSAANVKISIVLHKVETIKI